MRQKSLWRAAHTVCIAVGALAFLPAPAQAQYLDPGAGSIIVQAVIAVAVGVIAALKLYWGKLSAFVARRSKNDAER